MAGTRQDQYNVTVAINGTNYGTFDKMSGGDIDSEETKYNPGAMGAAVSLGGRKTVTNVTVSRLYDLQRDHHNAPTWIAAAGKADMTVVKQPLDADGNAFGAPIVYTGKLKMVQLPEHDSESNTAAMVTFEMSSAGTVS
jgi:hypothetical protein